MDPAEVEFLAEKETVKIIPNFSLDKVYLIGVRRPSRSFCGSSWLCEGAATAAKPPTGSDPCCCSLCCVQGDLGPFNPGLPVDVPVWLALNLKQRQKCRIVPPEWMDVGQATTTTIRCLMTSTIAV